MSMSQPMEPGLGREGDGIPAADPGAGAPETAAGFGVAGEEPDRTYPPGERADPPDAPPTRDDVPFRTPDPGELQGD